jgi:hypothetical protein
MGANDDIHVESLSYSLCDTIKITQKNPLQVSIGPITRSMAHKVKDVSNELTKSIWANVNLKEATSSRTNDQILINLTYV